MKTEKMTLAEWKKKRPKGTIYYGVSHPYIRYRNGQRREITEGLKNHIIKLRATL